jgi:hypothetical protein
MSMYQIPGKEVGRSGEEGGTVCLPPLNFHPKWKGGLRETEYDVTKTVHQEVPRTVQ